MGSYIPGLAARDGVFCAFSAWVQQVMKKSESLTHNNSSNYSSTDTAMM
ncbi:MAG TPA: hypothetical protein VKO63_00300 [Chitinispirillaceae bacterium]|nr:hypothetical protein [Chitinispirillaceae bacterium]